MEHLKKLRLQKGVTQQEIAKILDVDRTAYVKWETGKNYPSVDLLQKLAQYFDVTVDYLLGLSKDPITQKQPSAEAEGNKELAEIMALYRSAPDELKKAAVAVLKSGGQPPKGGD